MPPAAVVFDAYGTLLDGKFGFRVVWVNRSGQSDEYGLRDRVAELSDLAALPGRLAA